MCFTDIFNACFRLKNSTAANNLKPSPAEHRPFRNHATTYVLSVYKLINLLVWNFEKTEIPTNAALILGNWQSR